MIGIFRTDIGTGQKLSWLGTPASRPAGPDYSVYDVASATLTRSRIFLGGPTSGILNPITWFGCIFPDVERMGILVSYPTATPPGGHPSSFIHYTRYGELNPDTTLYAEEPQDHVPIGIIKLASGALVAAFYSLTLDGNKVQYSFNYRTTPQTGSVWKAPISVSLPFVASTDTTQSCTLVQHWDHTIYFFRHLANDSAIGSINLVENETLGTIGVNMDPNKVPNSSFISTAHTLPPFVGSPQLRATLDVYRQGIVLAYQTSVDSATNNRARMAFCFIASNATKTFVQMTGKYVLNSGEFEIGSKADDDPIWFAGECLDDAGAALPIHVGVYSASNWSFTNTGTIQNPIYPVRDDFGSQFGSGLVSGFGYVVSGNIYFKSFAADYPASPAPPGKAFWVTLADMDISSRGYKVSSMAIDSADNTTTVSGYLGIVTVGSFEFDSSGVFNGLIYVCDPNGNVTWAKSLASSNNATSIFRVIADSENSIIVLGTFIGTIDCGDGVSVVNPTTRSAVFVVKYSSAHVCQWAKCFYGNDQTPVTQGPLAVDSNNDVIVACGIAFYSVFDSIILETPSYFDSDIALVKLNKTTGAVQWANKHGGSNAQNAFGMAVDTSANNDIVLVGKFTTSADFGSGTAVLTSGGSADAFVAKFSSDGTVCRWSRGLSGPKIDVANAVAIDGNGNIIVGGNFGETINLGSGVVGSEGGAFLSCYSGDGLTHRWGKITGSVSLVAVTSVNAIAARNGKLIIVGRSATSINWGTYPQDQYLFSSGANFFIASFYLNGNSAPTYRWTNYVGLNQQVLSDCNGTAIDSAGNAYVTGNFNASLDFVDIVAAGHSLDNSGFTVKYKN